MKLILFAATVLFSSFGFSSRAYVAIHCGEDVTVYAEAALVTGMPVTIEFLQDEEWIQEEGVLSIRSDKSLLANSKSIIVYGNRLGTGYFIQSPSRDPYAGHCQSLKF